MEEAHAHIDSIIHHHETAIAACNATIIALHNQINNIQITSTIYQARIFSLRSQRNEYTEIYRLPVEVLCQIFSFAQINDRGEMLPFSEWTEFTRVSRHWRNVALEYRYLWANITMTNGFNNSYWAEQAVKRSKGAKLVINIFGEKAFFPSVLHISRFCQNPIRGLRVSYNSVEDIWMGVQSTLAQFQTPYFEFLDLEGVDARSYSHPVSASRWCQYPAVSEDVLRNNLQRLRNMRLVNCSIDWSSNPLFQSAMTHLTVRNPALMPTSKQFVFALKEMPNLQYLDLENAFPPADQTTIQAHVHFYHLKYLHLYSCISDEVEDFFGLVTFPPGATVQVKIGCSMSPGRPNIPRITAAVSKSYSLKPNAPGPIFRSISLFQPISNKNHTSGLKLVLFKTRKYTEQLIYDPGDIGVDFRLEFCWRTQSSSTEERLVMKQFINAIFSSSLPLQGIQCMSLAWRAEQQELTPDLMMNTFGKLSNVDTVVTGGNSSRPLVDAFDRGLASQEAPNGSQVEHIFYFPKVSSMCFCNARIINSKSAPNPVAVPVELIQDCLVRQCKRGIEIKNVSFIQCRGLGQEETVYAMQESLFNGFREAMMSL
ncbi:hypothetical protein BDN70DRAFT_930824 [Pholiota conissans]|uniref:F-box domain-containing protein n=1 Tax=Pholiota conissans TaxID=109636 RepID=A0A9P5Z8P3_9AGAR|nr:hypothetical protein BDN70DRAFT_930824 [Pholiota conissans]